MTKEYTLVLQKYISLEAAEVISQWIVKTGCEFNITKSRSSKFGDYRAPYGKKGHRISVNHDLNPHAFLITTVHEFAHLKTWNEHKHRVKPHGLAWKSNFKSLMDIFFEKEVFPEDIRIAVQRYLENAKASSCSDDQLFRTLKKYDPIKENHHTVESLGISTVFALKNGRVFEKREKVRTRYRCIELSSGRIYLFSPLAEVQLIPRENRKFG